MSQTPKLVAILAGGKATRFGGQDKGEIRINDRRLIDIVHDRLKLQASDIIISGEHDYDLGFDIVPDFDTAPAGPVGGIYSTWQALSGRDLEGFYTAACDGPNVPLDLTECLYHSNRSTIAADGQGRHPTYGWWRMKDLASIWENMDFTQSISLNRLADLAGAEEVVWAGGDAFLNINRQSDLDKLVKRA